MSATDTSVCCSACVCVCVCVHRWVYGLYHERILNTTAFWPNTTSAHWQYMAPPVVDNYYTRSLLGEATYKLPAGRVTAEHGAYAQLLVAQYDVLLVLEQSNSRKLGLGLGLGWKDIEQVSVCTCMLAADLWLASAVRIYTRMRSA